MSINWHRVCAADDIDEEDVIGFDCDGRTFAVYNTEHGFFASDGLCTHEAQHLSEGLVMGDIIECPLHQGRFHIPTGKATGAPVCEDLMTYPVKIENGDVYIQLP